MVILLEEVDLEVEIEVEVVENSAQSGADEAEGRQAAVGNRAVQAGSWYKLGVRDK